MRIKGRKVINLALQGSGAHGAFTWGVLDRLLEDERLTIEGISGTSSGAMNAVAVAHGLTVGDRDDARRTLAELWHRIGAAVPAYSREQPYKAERTLALEGALALTRVLSPYQLNPLNVDPLREIVTDLFEFERLRKECRQRLYIAATQVRTGKLRLFETAELSPDALLASACLPALRHAVILDGEAYWDGAYAGNPALFPLFYECEARDMIIVLLQPLTRPDLPTAASDIHNRTAELSSGMAFLREIRALAQAKAKVADHRLRLGRLERSLRRFHVHLIEPDQFLAEQDGISKYDNDARFLSLLQERGRLQADAWLAHNFDNLSRRSSIDLPAIFC